MPNLNHDQLTGSDLHDNKVYPATGTPLPAWTQTDARYVRQTRSIATTSPLTGGGSLAGDLTLSLPQASSTQGGYLSPTDWSTFNAKGFRTFIVVGPSGSSGNDFTATSSAQVAIQAAIDAVHASGGGTVYLRPDHRLRGHDDPRQRHGRHHT